MPSTLIFWCLKHAWLVNVDNSSIIRIFFFFSKKKKEILIPLGGQAYVVTAYLFVLATSIHLQRIVEFVLNFIFIEVDFHKMAATVEFAAIHHKF